jgi:CBS domain-containing protein
VGTLEGERRRVAAMRSLPLVSDFMDESFPTVLPDMAMDKAMKLLVKKKLTGVLVVDDQKSLIGLLSEKDCLKILLQHGFDRFPDDVVRSYMHPVPMTVESNLDIIRASQIFMDNTFRRLAVVDDGKLVGQITRRDIVKGMEKYFKGVR